MVDTCLACRRLDNEALHKLVVQAYALSTWKAGESRIQGASGRKMPPGIHCGHQYNERIGDGEMGKVECVVESWGRK